MTPSTNHSLGRIGNSIGLLTIFITSVSAPFCLGSNATVIETINFDDTTLPNQDHYMLGGWFIGSQSGGKITVEKDPYRPGKSLKAHYPIATGGMYNWTSFDLSKYNTSEILVEFDARMPGTPQGIKFFKIFGQDDKDGDVANTTFGLVSDEDRPGSLLNITYGDGTDTSNDVRNIINLGGGNREWAGRAWGKGAKIYTKSEWLNTSWKDNWHHFEIKAKFNTGSCIAGLPKIPEINDGAYLIKIDGETYLDATGLFNRHCKNLPIRHIAFFDWGQNGTVPFDVWIDNVKISIITTDTSTNAEAATGAITAKDPILMKHPEVLKTPAAN